MRRHESGAGCGAPGRGPTQCRIRGGYGFAPCGEQAQHRLPRDEKSPKRGPEPKIAAAERRKARVIPARITLITDYGSAARRSAPLACRGEDKGKHDRRGPRLV
jgi:hypothetical protein